MQRIVPTAILIVALAISRLDAGHSTSGRIDVSGTYNSNWGEVTLRQSGNKVTGTYVYQNGRLEGTLDGNILRYTWRENQTIGRGMFVVATDSELMGSWGVGSDDLSGGAWRLVPLTRTALAN